MSGPRIALTRALPEAEHSAARLRALGAEPIVAPLLEMAPRAFAADTNGVQALLFTSANGVRAAQSLRERGLPVLAVGEATARAALDAGFTGVRSADGDVRALAQLAASSLDPKAGALLYVSGAHVAGDLIGALQHAGFAASRVIAYDAKIVAALPSAYARPLDVVAFHSARAAHAFASFGAPNAAQLIAACISPAVADITARAAIWAQVVVAPAPQDAALWTTALAVWNAQTGASA